MWGKHMNQQSVFKKRLARVATHTGNTNATLHIGMDDQLQQAAFLRQTFCGRKVKGQASQSPLMLSMALVSGIAGWVWGQWMRASLFTPEDALVALAADMTIGITAILLLRAILGLRGVQSLTFQVIGLSIAQLADKLRRLDGTGRVQRA